MIDDYNQLSNVLSFFQSRKNNNNDLIVKLCLDNNIDISKNESLLNKSFYEVYIKMQYLKENNIPLYNKYGLLHELFFISEVNMINIYGISVDELLEKYIDGSTDSIGNEYVKIAVLKK